MAKLKRKPAYCIDCVWNKHDKCLGYVFDRLYPNNNAGDCICAKKNHK
jgi:hypothetical protein